MSAPDRPVPPAPADLVLRNGRVVSAAGVVEADVAVTAGTIVAVTAPGQAFPAR